MKFTKDEKEKIKKYIKIEEDRIHEILDSEEEYIRFIPEIISYINEFKKLLKQ